MSTLGHCAERDQEQDHRWSHADSSFTGRKAIQARAEAGNPNVASLHIMSSSLIEVIDSEHASGVHYATLYPGFKPDSRKVGDVVPVANFRVMGEFHDKFVLTDEGWKLSKRR